MFHRSSVKGLALSFVALLSGCGIEGATTSLKVDDGASRYLADSSHFEKMNAPKTNSIRIGVYNVENFWDDVDENTKSPYDDYSAKASNWIADNMAHIKAQHVAQAIRLAGSPEILGLVEIESAGNQSRSLDLLKAELKGQGYSYYALGFQNETTSVTTAVISKFPIVQNESLDFKGSASARDPQAVTIDVSGNPVKLYVSHWKSKSRDSGQGDNMRMAIARLIKQDIDATRARDPNLDIVVMGDFNSEYNETQMEGHPSGVVEGLQATGDERMMLGKSMSERLYNLWFELPQSDRCSYSYNGKRSCIDNILVTDSLFDNSGLQLVDNSFSVVGLSGRFPGEDALINADGTPLRWQVQPAADPKTHAFRHMGIGFSDHLPIVAEFNVVGKKSSPTKVTRQNPSTTEYAGTERNDDIVPVCEPKVDSYLNLASDDFSSSKNWKRCFRLTSGTYQIYKLDAHNVGVRIGGSELMLYMTRAYGHNKSALTKLRKTEGKVLENIEGRVGWVNGRLAIFADSIKSILTR